MSSAPHPTTSSGSVSPLILTTSHEGSPTQSRRGSEPTSPDRSHPITPFNPTRPPVLVQSPHASTSPIRAVEPLPSPVNPSQPSNYSWVWYVLGVIVVAGAAYAGFRIGEAHGSSIISWIKGAAEVIGSKDFLYGLAAGVGTLVVYGLVQGLAQRLIFKKDTWIWSALSAIVILAAIFVAADACSGNGGQMHKDLGDLFKTDFQYGYYTIATLTALYMIETLGHYAINKYKAYKAQSQTPAPSQPQESATHTPNPPSPLIPASHTPVTEKRNRRPVGPSLETTTPDGNNPQTPVVPGPASTNGNNEHSISSTEGPTFDPDDEKRTGPQTMASAQTEHEPTETRHDSVVRDLD